MDYFGDPLSLLRRKKVEKSNAETWGDIIIYEVKENRKLLQRWYDLELHDMQTGDDATRYLNDLMASWRGLLTEFARLEIKYENRLELKEQWFLNPERLRDITFGADGFYKTLNHNIESIRLLNKALEALIAITVAIEKGAHLHESFMLYIQNRGSSFRFSTAQNSPCP